VGGGNIPGKIICHKSERKMPKKPYDEKKGWLQHTSAWLQVVFYIVVSIGTIYNLYNISRQNKLIYRPVIGITDTKITRHLKDIKVDTFESVDQITVDFMIENVGNLPAKDFKIKPYLKIGDTVLPYEDVEYKGSALVQKTKVKNTAKIKKEVIDRVIKNKEKLTYTIPMTYTDWENYENYYSESTYEIRVKKIEPLDVEIVCLSAEIGIKK
jgi:hypothetical protein